MPCLRECVTKLRISRLRKKSGLLNTPKRPATGVFAQLAEFAQSQGDLYAMTIACRKAGI